MRAALRSDCLRNLNVTQQSTHNTRGVFVILLPNLHFKNILFYFIFILLKLNFYFVFLDVHVKKKLKKIIMIYL
jgi:hypothetical protein